MTKPKEESPEAFPHEKWVEGHAAGYAKGRDDGIGIGYSDAKLRTYRALDAVASDCTPAETAAIRKLEEALASTIGKR